MFRVQCAMSGPVLALLLACGLAGGAAADTADPLRAAIAAIPAAPITGAARDGGFRFADIAAGAAAVAALDPAALQPPFDGPDAGVFRAAPLDDLPEVTVTATADWPPRVGFAPADMRTVLGLGVRPDTASVITLRPGLGASATAALTAAGYDRSDVPGGVLLRRGTADHAVDFAQRDPADPFGGMLGQSARILIRGDVLAWSSGMAALDHLARGPTWGERPDMAVILNALDGLPEGTLIVRAMALTDPTLFMGGSFDALVQQALETGELPADLPPEPATGVPPWSLALIADTAQGAQSGVAIALAYPTEALARDAAARLAAGWAVPGPVSGTSPAQRIGKPAITVAGQGPFVTLVQVAGVTETAPYLRNPVFGATVAMFHARDLPQFGPALP